VAIGPSWNAGSTDFGALPLLKKAQTMITSTRRRYIIATDGTVVFL
jgi:hypothetical protein